MNSKATLNTHTGDDLGRTPCSRANLKVFATLRDTVALGLILFSSSVFGADFWVTTDSGCEVWSNEALAANESISWSGTCQDGRLSGDGHLTFSVEGKPVLQFEGEMRGGKAYGTGTLEEIVDGGTIRYEGDFKDSLSDGYGVLTLANGDRYEGTFSQDKPDGFGIYTGVDGSMFQGDLKAGVPDGQGFEKLPDGARYNGGFKNGEYDGNGTLLFPNGDLYEGTFRNGEAHGKGLYITQAGERYEGAWNDGKADGDFIVTKPDGSTETQRWRADKLVQ